jgi:PLP dependent protein
MNRDRLAHNLERVRTRIAAACDRAGREPDSITLVAVTKTVGVETARALVELGVTDIGENRIQVAKEKVEALAGLGVTWHMIGHLQTNKAKDALRMFDLIHSVDTARLADALDKRGAVEEKIVPVLVQVNCSGEESKFGVDETVAIDEVRRIADHSYVRVCGLMTMAPFVDSPEDVRPVFVHLRRLAEKILAVDMASVEMTHLSMGMTQDFEVAIEEGATLIRVGTALFAGVED